jgi:hypothetical protein
MKNNKSLGRKVPKDMNHVAKYPLTLTSMPVLPVPVCVGVNWYTAFDRPVKDKDGKWWVKSKNLGSIRGGHCVCMPHVDTEPYSWYSFYNQGAEGACVGFGSSRMMSILNKERYDARWLWDRAKEIDEWPETNPGDNEGTSVRAAMDVLRTIGHKTIKGKPDPKNGISANRWATNIDDLFSVLQNETYKKIGAIPFFNSWGTDYPRKVWMPCETWQRLLNEEGEATMVTDK